MISKIPFRNRHLDIHLHFSYIQVTQKRVLITLFLDQLGAELLEPISWQQKIEEIA